MHPWSFPGLAFGVEGFRWPALLASNQDSAEVKRNSFMTLAFTSVHKYSQPISTIFSLRFRPVLFYSKV